MFMLGPIGFTTPLLLLGLLALPILWLLLRAVPPAPIRRRFPGVALLLGLKDAEAETDKTPWWLLLLRMIAIAAAIIGFAGPVLNPDQRETASTGPLLILMDASWADARDWPRRLDRTTALLDEAARTGRPVALIRLTDAPTAPVFQAAGALSQTVAGVTPNPWTPDFAAWATALPPGDFASFWLSDGLDHPGRATLRDALQSRGQLTVFESPRPIIALRPAQFADGVIQLSATRLPATDNQTIEISARGLDPAGIERELARIPLTFAADDQNATTDLSLPPELRNRVSRFELAGIRSAAAVTLTDDSLKRRKVALISNTGEDEALQLLSPTHYLRQALDPVAELIDGSVSDIILANPDVIVLADVATLSPLESDQMLDWLDTGGLLLRFAGPRLAASDISRDAEDALLPVRLRAGGRNVGGAMSWGEPKFLAGFAEGSPFFGLQIPPDVTVSAQVLAQPDPDLAARTIAALADGTPLVTRKPVGQGQVVLFHVTANAEWSTLPLSGLFVQMLERLAVSTRPAAPDAADLAGQTWVPQVALDAFGRLNDAGEVAGVDGQTLATALSTTGPSAALPPGLYAGDDRRVALNVTRADTTLTPAAWPATITREGLDVQTEQALKGTALATALSLLLIDILAALALSGRLLGTMRNAAMIATALLLLNPHPSHAQIPDDLRAIEATSALRLGYVVTGDARVDDISRAGLAGLGQRLFERTTIEPESPLAVNLESDELLFFPFLYWPVTVDQPMPSAAAYAALNRYLRTGGMILFDTRDGDIAGAAQTPAARKLQLLAAPLDIPPLEILPEDHVLTRSFYLLQDFPGRHNHRDLWVEASPPDAELAEGMPFRNLNDGVTPVVIGGNDWAAAWALDARGAPMFPVGRGFAGDRQREIATRFGINLIMHVLTGNYKSDQVHVPALLERLGQ
ncbi:N-terminal double-transmembrane domain-containing protein [Pseudorhodobacter antarcticus]|uniref:N-terminal double-transmembrane domain-containing protein n=1 Tax=Pseudorhodobacter antarcticus TaxID=1077947 RepID=A0A1H8B567_9RHOB|nr:DUF4159 domain-containing protein [Pseudorhodobacter antarcticus]SEM77439.1 N-terminal double-transmembrane domain-containing protein [Pseudorhodobacter antarcticus]